MFIRATMMATPMFALAACSSMQTDGEVRSYGNDGLPSAEVLAFQRADARLKWLNARIEWDTNLCAVYQGRDASGATRSEPLRDADNSPLCTKR